MEPLFGDCPAGDSPSSDDAELQSVAAWLREPKRLDAVGTALRSALDWVIDGAKTGRYSVSQLEKEEEIYIGKRVENEVLHRLKLPKKGPLDTIIRGVVADVKFSLAEDWMVPEEALGHICILLSADDERSRYRVGLFRACLDNLHSGSNKDKKRGISAEGKRRIWWLRRDGALPENILLHLESEVRLRIMSHPSGQFRVNELFRRVLERPLTTTVIDSVAVQRDPSKRVRDARPHLQPEDIAIFQRTHGYYNNAVLRELGLPELERKGMWMSVRLPERMLPVKLLKSERGGRTEDEEDEYHPDLLDVQ